MFFQKSTVECFYTVASQTRFVKFYLPVLFVFNVFNNNILLILNSWWGSFYPREWRELNCDNANLGAHNIMICIIHNVYIGIGIGWFGWRIVGQARRAGIVASIASHNTWSNGAGIVVLSPRQWHPFAYILRKKSAPTQQRSQQSKSHPNETTTVHNNEQKQPERTMPTPTYLCQTKQKWLGEPLFRDAGWCYWMISIMMPLTPHLVHFHYATVLFIFCGHQISHKIGNSIGKFSSLCTPTDHWPVTGWVNEFQIANSQSLFGCWWCQRSDRR